jgi:signal transduction histidine kinase
MDHIPLTSEQLTEQLRESQALLEISQMLAGTIDLPTILGQIAEAATSLIKTADRTTLHLLDEFGSRLEPVAVAGRVTIDPSNSVNFKPGEGIAGLVLSSGKSITVPDIEFDPRYIPSGGQEIQVRSLLVAPVRTGQKNLGTLSVQSPQPGVFTADDERLLTILGVQAAVAIEKAKLYSDLQASLQHEKAFRAQLVQSEKLAALGRIVASVAHELNNPIQAIQNALYLVQMEENLTAQAQEDVKTVLAETDRMASLIARLREIYRPVVIEDFQPESINLLVLEVQTLINTHLRHNRVYFEFLPDHNIPKIPVIRDQVKQVILNICLNAVEAMPDGGNLRIMTNLESAASEVSLKISDNGACISPHILPYIFDPFVTTKEGGTGLGLAISYDIVQRHNGRIEVESEAGKGTSFHVWLPIRKTIERTKKTR